MADFSACVSAQSTHFSAPWAAVYLGSSMFLAVISCSKRRFHGLCFLPRSSSHRGAPIDSPLFPTHHPLHHLAYTKRARLCINPMVVGDGVAKDDEPSDEDEDQYNDDDSNDRGWGRGPRGAGAGGRGGGGGARGGGGRRRRRQKRNSNNSMRESCQALRSKVSTSGDTRTSLAYPWFSPTRCFCLSLLG